MNSLIKYFNSADEITDLINKYFAEIGIDSKIETRLPKNKAWQKSRPKAKEKTESNLIVASPSVKLDPPTLSGLALYLGFQSLEDFETYILKGRYAYYARIARLTIISFYEKKLHGTYTSGAIYALKSIKWRSEKAQENHGDKTSNTFKVEISNAGPNPAGSEKEVMLS